MADQVQGSTMPQGATQPTPRQTMPDGSVQVLHVSPELLVDIFTTDEAQRADNTQWAKFKRYLLSAPQAEIEASLRGPTAEEKAAGNKLPPFVVKAVAKGWQESSARKTLSELRSIKSAWFMGDKGIYPIVKAAENTNEEMGWHRVVNLARDVTSKVRQARQTAAQDEFYAESIAIARRQVAGDAVKVTPEQWAVIGEEAEKIHQKRIADGNRDTFTADVESQVARIIKAARDKYADGDDMTHAYEFCDAVAKTLVDTVQDFRSGVGSTTEQEAAGMAADDAAAMKQVTSQRDTIAGEQSTTAAKAAA